MSETRCAVGALCPIGRGEDFVDLPLYELLLLLAFFLAVVCADDKHGDTPNPTTIRDSRIKCIGRKSRFISVFQARMNRAPYRLSSAGTTPGRNTVSTRSVS